MRRWLSATLFVAILMLAGTVGQATAAGEKNASSGEDVLKIGWAQDPQTLNPFIGLDEEDWTVWAINWDMLVNYNPKDLSPAPGIAESWEVSEDKKSVTFKLADRKWSDGKPVTSTDVKWTIDNLGTEGELFTATTENITSVETPDEKTVIVKTSRPDTRIVDNLLLYILPEHIWGKVPKGKLTTTYQPELPLVGTGPFITTKFDRGRQITMERNPEFSGDKPAFDRIEFIKYGNSDAVERALQLGEIDFVPEVQQTTFKRLGEKPNVETLKSPAPGFTEMAFNMCAKKTCPDAKLNPAIQDLPVRQAIAYGVDRERLNQIAAGGTAFVANGLLPSYYKTLFEMPDEVYPFDPDKANQILDDAGYTKGSDGIREKNGDRLSFNLYTRTRSEAPFDAQAANLIAEMTKEIGIEFKPQPVSVDRLTEVTARQVDGKPAPEFDSFIWGWSGDVSLLLSIMTTGEIGGSSDSFFSNAEYDRLFQKQSGLFDLDERREVIHQMINILQRELPYLVLIENPMLEAWRSDRIENVKPTCPEGDGDALCLQTGYAPLLTLAPAGEGGSGGGGGNTGLIVIIAAVVLGAAALLVIRSRRRGSEALELEEEPEEDDGR
ncbi:MAG: peptide ABC transporter substrate-binding protein [Solirubrobacterales bacterium]|nr:peptide ABC transporter substrate-binding protein [Solirubrobacterales bacterium]